ncbi:MAG: hypothetical protein NTZ20_05165 [Candidatus Levybacteria bacterium]|nr:hypothetical protein [Candidatus Levybacteria bacterium]
MKFFEKYTISPIPTVKRNRSKFFILNIENKTLRWSNSDGWVESGYTIFNSTQRNNVSLPMEGEWNK